MRDNERPLNRSDYERAYAMLIALRSKAMYHDDDRPLWEILRDLHSEKLGYGLDEDEVDAIVGPDAAEREFQHAMIVLEMLVQGRTTIRRNAAARPVQSVCATLGCPNLTTEHFCMHCELGLSS